MKTTTRLPQVLLFATAVTLTALLAFFSSLDRNVGIVVLGALASAFLAILARNHMPTRYRLAMLGITIGSGSLLYQLIGPAAAYILLVLVFVGAPRFRARPLLPTILWAAGCLAACVGMAITAMQASMPSARVLGMLSFLVAAGWAFSDEVRERPNSTVSAFIWAGAVSAIGVYISIAIGRPVFAAASSPFAGARASGFASAPNEVAIVLSAALLVATVHFLRRSKALGPLEVAKLGTFVAIVAGALVLTGSRASLLGFAGGAVIAFASTISRHPGRAVGAAMTMLIGALLILQSPLFAGRGFDVLSSQDGSAVYRRAVQGRLWETTDLSRIAGYGFVDGNRVVDNVVTNGVNNVDNAWLYSVLGYGALTTVGVLAILIAIHLRGLFRVGAVALATVPWFVVVTAAENVWALGGPAVLALLLPSAIAEAASRRDTYGEDGAPDL